MGTRYLIDTNTVIDYLDKKLPTESNIFFENLDVNLSIISRIELLAWRQASESQLFMLNMAISAAFVIDIDEDIVLKTIEIRRNHRLKLPDAIIAATALTNNLILLTRNLSDFKKGTGLKVANPYEL